MRLPAVDENNLYHHYTINIDPFIEIVDTLGVEEQVSSRVNSGYLILFFLLHCIYRPTFIYYVAPFLSNLLNFVPSDLVY